MVGVVSEYYMDKHQIKKNVKLKMVRSVNVELPRHTSSLNIPVEEVAELFRCGRCSVAPIKPPVYICRSGHLTCVLCYGRVSRDCCKCKEPLLGRNSILEEVVRALPIQTCAALTECSAPLRESRSEQSLRLLLQDPSHLEKLEKARLEAEERQEGEDLRTSSTTSLSTIFEQRVSHRPVMCPFPCGRIVTCSAMLPHFELHHPRVDVRTVSTEMEQLVDLQFENLLSKESRCQGIFLVRLDGPLDQEDNDKWAAANLLKITRSSQSMLLNGCFIASVSVGLLINPLSGDNDASFLTVWAACLYDFAPMTYTVCASNDISPHSVSFTGPLTSLRKSQRPADVYARGECLLIPPGLLREMHLDKNALKLTVTFHADLPFPLKLADCLDIPVDDKHLLDI